MYPSPPFFLRQHTFTTASGGGVFGVLFLDGFELAGNIRLTYASADLNGALFTAYGLYPNDVQRTVSARADNFSASVQGLPHAGLRSVTFQVNNNMAPVTVTYRVRTLVPGVAPPNMEQGFGSVPAAVVINLQNGPPAV